MTIPVMGVCWCPELAGEQLEAARRIAGSQLRSQLSYLDVEHTKFFEIHSWEDARLTELVPEPHATNLATRLHAMGGVVILAVEDTVTITEIRCPVCTRMLFGDMADRGFCLGCVPEITL